jgi:hypothetical protein
MFCIHQFSFIFKGLEHDPEYRLMRLQTAKRPNVSFSCFPGSRYPPLTLVSGLMGYPSADVGVAGKTHTTFGGSLSLLIFGGELYA